MTMMCLKKEITDYRKLFIVILLIIILSFIGINGFINPFTYLAKNEVIELEIIENNNSNYYKVEEVSYIIINHEIKNSKGNEVVKATYYDNEFKFIEKESYITKKGYNCFKKNSTASFLTIELVPKNSVTMLGSDTKWIDVKSTIITTIGIIIVYLIQHGIFTLKKLYSK